LAGKAAVTAQFVVQACAARSFGLIQINDYARVIVELLPRIQRRQPNGENNMAATRLLLAMLVSGIAMTSPDRGFAQDAAAGAAVFKSQCGISTLSAVPREESPAFTTHPPTGTPA
jgi:hypothetical protein